MKLDIYDTCVYTQDGQLVHFDVMVPVESSKTPVQYAREWLSDMNITYTELSQENCRYCHSEIATPEVTQQINQYGYFIFQMEGCPAAV